jgi:hypothetical protein
MSWHKAINVILLLYLIVFGVALSFSGILRISPPFWVDAIIEISFSMMGSMIVMGAVMAFKNKKLSKHPESKSIKYVLLALAISIALVVLVQSSHNPLPGIFSFILTAGIQFGSTLVTVVKSVLTGKFDIPFVGSFFSLIPWLFQIWLVHELVLWIQTRYAKRV